MQIMYPSTFYSHVKVDIPHELMKHVIGVNGKWFKYTCEKCFVANIWFNKNRSIVEIWGPIHNLMAANYAIQSRINVIKSRFSFDNKEPVKMWPNDEYEEILLKEISIDDKFVGSQLSMDHLRILIGKFGNGFKRIPRESEASFIWYNSVQQSIQLWGTREGIDKAKDIIIDRVNTIFSTMIQNET